MSYQNDHVGAGALPSSNTHFQIVQQTIHDFIGITPAGPYCLLCHTAFQPDGWRSHFNNKHADISKTLPKRLEDIIRILHYQVREAKKGNVSLYKKSDKLYKKLQCSGCSSILRDKSHTQQHYKSTRNNCSAIMHPCTRITCIQFKCGRFYPATNQPEEQQLATRQVNPTPQATALPQYAAALLPSQDQIAQQPALHFAQYFAGASLPPNNIVPVDVVDAVLAQLIDSDDTTKDWRTIFFKYIATSSNFIDERKRDLKSDSLNPRMVLSDPDSPLGRLMDLFVHLESYTKSIADGMPTHWKAMLVKFVIPTDDNEVGEIGAANMYTFRHRNNPSPQLRMFGLLICYLRYHNSPILDKYIQLVSRPDYSHNSAASACIISNLLFELAAERLLDGDYIPWICRFCLYNCFHIDRESDLPKLNKSSTCGKIFATVLYILRQGILACVAGMVQGGHDQQVPLMVKAIQQCPPIHIISPWIATCRNMTSKQAESETSHVASNGDIICNRAVFCHTIIIKLIPLLRIAISDIFGTIFSGDDWKLFLRGDSIIKVTGKWFQGDVTVSNGDRTIHLSDLNIHNGYNGRHTLFQQLVSLIEIIFLGLGGGAERLTTVVGLSANQLWLAANNHLYFYAVHDKVASVKSPTKQACKHKIPPSLVPIYLLFRRIVIELGLGNTSAVIPNIERRTVLMKHALCNFFGISIHDVSVTDIRHLFASVTNIIFQQHPIALTADKEGAEANNHSSTVHRRWYGTSVIGGPEQRYKEFHNFFGEGDAQSEINSQITRQPVSNGEIRSALQIMYGPLAEFNSSEQEEMVRCSCISKDRNKFYGLGCGIGKSLSLLIPVAVDKMSMQFTGCRMFVLPYVFLLESIREAFVSKLQNFDVSIIALTGASIDEESPPHDLKDCLPDILLLTVDAAAKLIRYHHVLLRTWHEAKLIQGIYFDEVQSFLGEFSFRQVYQQLHLYATIGAPITLLSGSYPPQLVPSLLRGLQLITPEQSTTSADIVQSPDLVGTGIEFNVTVVESGIVSATLQMVQSYITQYNHAVHILCASRKDCEAFGEKLQGRYDVRIIHSGTPKVEQAEAAKAWYNGEVTQLYTTSLGTVGNENDKLGAVFVVGLLFNLSTLLQCYGRLRPRYRGEHSMVHQLISPQDFQYNNARASTDRNTQSDLINSNLVSESDITVYKKAFSVKGYIEFINSDGCYLRKFRDIFSSNETSTSCGNKCTWCNTGHRHMSYNDNTANNNQQAAAATQPSTIYLTQVMDLAQATVRTAVGNDTSAVTPPKANVTVVNPYIKKRKATQITEVQQATDAARISNQRAINTRANADLKLSSLKHICPMVGCRPSCNGEYCLRGACYICHCPSHKTVNCPFSHKKQAGNSLDKFMTNKGFCPYCLDKMTGSTDLHGVSEGEKAKDAKCPLKKRLRRAFGIRYYTSEYCGKMTWGAFIRNICSTDDNYYDFVSKLDIDVSAPIQTYR